MRTSPALAVASLLLVPLAACAHGATTRPTAAGVRQLGAAAVLPGALPALDASLRRCATNLEDARGARGSDLLVPMDVALGHAENVLTIIRRHRARWLFTRTAGGATAPAVYLDGMRLGDPEALRVVTAASVHLARRITAPQAQVKYGMNHPEGAIELYTYCGDE